MSLIDLDFSDDELANLFAAPPPQTGAAQQGQAQQAAEPPDVEATEELVALTRKLAAQYIDVLAAFARDSFRGDGEIDTHGVAGAIDALDRLAESTNDTDLLKVLRQLAKLVDASSTAHESKSRVRDLMRVQMRHWVLRFADCLEGDDRKRMRELVLFDKSNVPLFDQLARIRGIGPRRIQRMYCAGLFTVETVIQSTPDDISSVTGIPLALARRIHDETAKYAEEMKGRAVEDLVAAVDNLKNTLPRFTEKDGGLARRIKRALADLQQTVDNSPWGGTP